MLVLSGCTAQTPQTATEIPKQETEQNTEERQGTSTAH